VKLTGIHVDGYGTLADLDLDGLAPTLTVVYGMNEAGKSTLLDFVRAVLFGFPDRRSRQNARPPLRGGRHGGSLRLLDEDGRLWVIERHADARNPVVTGPDGRLGGDAELHALLGGANAGLFRSIFAFGLDELTSLETLDDDDVRDLVFAAGVLGAGRSATRAMRELENRRGAIVRQRSSDARANQLRHRLDDTETRLRTTRDAAEGYASAEAGYRRLQTETGSARERLDDLRRRDVQLDRLRSCWPYWNRIHDAEARLAALGPPSAAAEQLTRFASEIRRLDAECSADELRLGALRQSQVELAGIERSRADLVEQRKHLEGSRPPVPAPDGRDRADDPGGAPRNEAELRRADQEVLLLRGLIGQRDQLLAAQRQQETMERLARRSPGVSRPAIALAFVATAFVATAVVAAFEFSKHNAALGAVGALAALALGAAAALIITGARTRTTAPLRRDRPRRRVARPRPVPCARRGRRGRHPPRRGTGRATTPRRARTSPRRARDQDRRARRRASAAVPGDRGGDRDGRGLRCLRPPRCRGVRSRRQRVRCRAMPATRLGTRRGRAGEGRTSRPTRHDRPGELGSRRGGRLRPGGRPVARRARHGGSGELGVAERGDQGRGRRRRSRVPERP